MSGGRRVAALVLAAGGSSRLGAPKPLLRLDGEPLVARAARAAACAGCDDVVVVVGAAGDAVTAALRGLPVRAAPNPAWREGMASSLRCGLAAAAEVRGGPPDAVLVMLADQPRVDAALLGRVVRAYREEGHPLVACAYAGTVGPPALFSGEAIDALARLEGDRGAKAVLLARAERLYRIPCEAAAQDVDTPEDAARLLPSERPESAAEPGQET